MEEVVKLYMEKAKARYDRIKATIEEKIVDMKIESQSEVQELNRLKSQAEGYLNQLQSATADQLDSLQQSMDETLNELERKWQELVSKFQ